MCIFHDDLNHCSGVLQGDPMEPAPTVPVPTAMECSAEGEPGLLAGSHDVRHLKLYINKL